MYFLTFLDIIGTDLVAFVAPIHPLCEGGGVLLSGGSPADPIPVIHNCLGHEVGVRQLLLQLWE